MITTPARAIQIGGPHLLPLLLDRRRNSLRPLILPRVLHKYSHCHWIIWNPRSPPSRTFATDRRAKTVRFRMFHLRQYLPDPNVRDPRNPNRKTECQPHNSGCTDSIHVFITISLRHNMIRLYNVA